MYIDNLLDNVTFIFNSCLCLKCSCVSHHCRSVFLLPCCGLEVSPKGGCVGLLGSIRGTRDFCCGEGAHLVAQAVLDRAVLLPQLHDAGLTGMAIMTS